MTYFSGKPEPFASVPADHPYVRHSQFVHPAVEQHPDAVERYREQPSRQPAEPWEPSPLLDPTYLDKHRGDFDLVHLHFGYEHLTVAEFDHWLARLSELQVALVLTVHDLDNPQLTDQRRHHALLASALRQAAAVITLTPGAAAELADRFGARPIVLPHPHQLPLALVGERASARNWDRPRLAVPLGSLRPNIDAQAVLSTLGAWREAGGLDPAELSLRVHPAVFTEGFTRRPPDERRALVHLMERGVGEGWWTIDQEDGSASEYELWQMLSTIDALLLPYRWGSHSGWVEACADVGTSVIAPRLGYWGQQQPLIELPPWSEVGPADLDTAVRRLRDRTDPAGGGRQPEPAAERARQRNASAEVLEQLYHRALRDRSTGSS